MITSTIRQELSLQEGQFELSKDVRIVICGCGALGSHIVEALVRAGFCTREGVLILVDNSEYHIENISTSTLYSYQLFQSKVEVCKHNSGLIGNGTNIETHKTYVNSISAKKLLRMGDIVIDCFDDTNNLEGRRVIIEWWKNSDKRVSVLHLGMSQQETGCILWNDKYVLPETYKVSEEVCDHAMSLSMILMITSLALKSIYYYLSKKQYLNYLVNTSDIISKL